MSITYPPEMLPAEEGAIVVVACNRPDCPGEYYCRHCEWIMPKPADTPAQGGGGTGI